MPAITYTIGVSVAHSMICFFLLMPWVWTETYKYLVCALWSVMYTMLKGTYIYAVQSAIERPDVREKQCLWRLIVLEGPLFIWPVFVLLLTETFDITKLWYVEVWFRAMTHVSFFACIMTILLITTDRMRMWTIEPYANVLNDRNGNTRTTASQTRTTTNIFASGTTSESA